MPDSLCRAEITDPVIMADINLEKLVTRGTLWRGRQDVSPAETVEPTGWEPLDALIGGWPRGALTELLSNRYSGLPLLIPALAGLSDTDRWLVWTAPPHLPYAPALAARGVQMEKVLVIRQASLSQRLWVTEQALRSGDCAAVLAWFEHLEIAPLRRLQLAAEQGGGIGVLFRPTDATRQSSPARLRLRVIPTTSGFDLEVLKRHGGWGGGRCSVRL
ncbi:MAG: translesion DNA synthesis-associated protein ImuA [Gammaproteobacteria bacterium]|nr:translesion DNA synthesis-associated protein ImuA [Gammaproteobacteria bacterium]